MSPSLQNMCFEFLSGPSQEVFERRVFIQVVYFGKLFQKIRMQNWEKFCIKHRGRKVNKTQYFKVFTIVDNWGLNLHEP